MSHRDRVYGAGILFIDAWEKKAFLLRRSMKSGLSPIWATPGGLVEAGESPGETARRETVEEIGFLPRHKLFGLAMVPGNFGGYALFLAHVNMGDLGGKVRLNDEHTAWGWFSFDHPPKDMHPGLRDVWKSL